MDSVFHAWQPGRTAWKNTACVVLALLAMTATAEVILDEPGRDGSIPTGWTANEVFAETAAGGYLRITNTVGWLATPTLDLSAYTNLLLSFDVAKFGSGADGPLTVQVSTNGGVSWDAMKFDSPIPVSNTYSNSGPHTLLSSAATRIRWTSENSPSQKRLRDILITGDLAPEPEVIPPYVRFQGFEGTREDYWSYQSFPGDGQISVSLDSRGQTGQYSLKLTGSDDGQSNPYVVFDNVDLTGLSNAVLSVAFAARGVDNNDDLYLDISYDRGITWPDSVQLMNGFGNFNLDFGETDTEHSVSDNPYLFPIPSQHSQIRVRVRFDEAIGATNRFDHYYIDDVRLTADGEQPFIRLGQSEFVVLEGSGSMTIPVVISEPTDAVVHVRETGPALPGVDYSLLSTTLVFQAHGSTTQYIELDIHGDALPRGPRFAHFTLEQAEGARLLAPDVATVVIRDSRSVTIMAANLPSGTNTASGFFPYDEASKRIFRLLRPDVVAIQEWILLPGETLQGFVDQHIGEGFHYFIEEADFPNGVISRWPILAAGEWVDGEVGNRDFAWASIDLPGPRNLHVVSVHFKAGQTPNDRDIRIRQARALTNYIALANFPTNDYLVVAGDLNLAGRQEETLEILGHWVSDEIQPADQEETRQTNIPRNQHYDFVLPNPLLEAAHLPFEFGGFVFSNGLVFDSRLWDQHLLPVRVGDAADVNMQHLAVVKLFELENPVLPPASLEAAALSASEVALSWTRNVNHDDVLIVFNDSGEFDTPFGPPPESGAPFAGGTVLYRGSATNLVHGPLAGCAPYHYAIWSIDGDAYSSVPRATGLSLTPPAAPTGLFADSLGLTEATLHWAMVPGVTEYRLDVSPSSTFMTGGEGGVTRTNSFAIASIEGVQDSTYATREWTESGIDWIAAKARIDQNINGQSTVTLRNEEGAYLLAESVPGGVGTIAFVHQQKFTGSGGTLEVFVNDISMASIATDTSVQTARVSGINISGPFTLMITNSGTVRPAIAELTWTSYDAETPLFTSGYEDRSVLATSQTVTGLTAGVTYWYRVRARVPPCESEHSVSMDFTTLTDPHLDTDGDGIPDWWEELYFGGPTNAVATNLAANLVNTLREAYVADLNPTDANSVFLLTVETTAPDALWLEFSPTSTGRVYDVHWSSNLLDGIWYPLGRDEPGTGEPLRIPVTNHAPNTYWRSEVRLP